MVSNIKKISGTGSAKCSGFFTPAHVFLYGRQISPYYIYESCFGYFFLVFIKHGNDFDTVLGCKNSQSMLHLK
jgi:hypothetical protein